MTAITSCKCDFLLKFCLLLCLLVFLFGGCGRSGTIQDSDKDGISDAADICPETPSEEIVNDDGCSESQLTPHVVVPLNADIAGMSSGSITEVLEGSTINLQATAYGGTPPYTHTWTFGNDSIDDMSVEDPGDVTFSVTGTYSITYTVTDHEGDSSNDSVTIIVLEADEDATPTAHISRPSGDTTILEGEAVVFEASALGGNPPYEYDWSFGDLGPEATHVKDAGSVVFENAGTYMVVFTVTDEDGDEGRDWVTVTVEDMLPVAEIISPSGDVTIMEGESVNFEAEVESGNEPYTHLWTFGGSGLSNQTVEDPGELTFTDPGVYTVTYTVTDNDGDESSDTVIITVNKDLIPTVSIISPSSNEIITAGESVDFAATVVSGDAPLSYEWVFSDCGNPANITVEDPGSVTFSEVGEYTVTLTVRDEDGDESSDTVTITVNEDLVPTASITSPSDGMTFYQGESVSFEGRVTSGNAPFTYAWTFDDNGPPDQYVEDPSGVVFSMTGTYNVIFTVTDNEGDSDNASVTVTVREAELTDGLVAYYPFNGNANDESGNGNIGIVEGATLSDDIFGDPDSAYYFDGMDDWIIGADSFEMNKIEQITISAWVAPTSQKTQKIVVKGSGIDAPYGLSLSATGNIVFSLQLEQNFVQVSRSGYYVGGWSFLACTYDGSQMNLYVNGVLESSASVSGSLDISNNILLIGSRLQLESDTFEGTIDNVRIYNRALNESEINDLFDAFN